MTLSEAALKYVGVKFRHRGRTARGVDCIGLLELAAFDCGYISKETTVYGREPKNGLLQNRLRVHFGAPINRPLQVNDVVAMSPQSDGQICHVGIITKHPQGLGICHAYGEIGRVVHQRLDSRRRKQIKEVFSW